ncbi:nuclear transport factor 2 family protein [Mycobacterium sp. DL440]|uniref:nuclear transport factor 2 family protein n=1 Tax=Mycobacterium sp. DL440 TaxID=2675523 RepID=UPI001422A740|nr:nuclear transport factor 2 family protein [Mycobacterium sp. DL440]
MTETSTETPVVVASRSSWKCVQSGDREGWLALMADDILVEDPIGEAVTNPDGTGVRGKEALGAFYDTNIGPNELTVTCEETFPSSSPSEIAYILVLRTKFPNGFTATVRGVFTYKVNDEGLITNLRGYWNIGAMVFAQEES